MSPQLDAMTSVTAALMTIAGVAALSNDLSHMVYYQANPLELETRLELERRYSQWAVKSVIAGCPQGDIECMEREAKRLSEVKLKRR